MASPPPLPDAGHPSFASSLLELSGTVLESRYQLGRVLGAGGMGAVFEAKHLRLDRAVAVKVLRPILAGHDDYIVRFHREARIASEIRHRNVVEVHDYGEAANGLVYSVMELLRGQDLDRYLETRPERRLPWPQALELLYQVASGLRAAHAAGIIHRDIKPANCFLIEGDDGELLVKVLDFGIAKVAEDAESITSTSEVFGTPSYIAPELVATKCAASPRSDVYSLGVLAYRMLAGRVPFSGDTPFQVLHRACFEPVPPLRNHGVEVPPAVEALVMRLLAKTPSKRPADMQEVRTALAALLRGTRGPAFTAGSGPVSLGSQPRGSLRLLGPSGTVMMPSPVESLPASSTPTPAAGHARNVIVSAEPSGAQGDAFEDSSSVPPPIRSGHTVLSPPPSSIPHGAVSAPQAIDIPVTRPSKRRGMALGSGAFIMLIAIGGVVLWSVLELPDPTPETSEVAATVIEPQRLPAPVAPAEGAEASAETEPLPSPESEADPNSADREPVLEPEPTPPLAPKPKATPTRRPSDAALEKRITRAIKSQCGKLMHGALVKVTFVVLPSGQATAPQATPKGPAGDCAKARLEGRTFRKRPKAVTLTIVVK